LNKWVYLPPRLCCWDECDWLELAKDWQVSYLLSDLAVAWALARSLHFCLQWYGQAEIDRLQSKGTVSEKKEEQNAEMSPQGLCDP
jgi:hypothetical protein